MPSEKDNTLEFNPYVKSDKIPYIIYADVKFKKIDDCANNPYNYSTKKVGGHILCRYSMSSIWNFDNIQNKHTLYHGEDFMKNCCTSLREHAKKIIDFENKKMLPLIKEELKSHQDQKYVIFAEKDS